MKGKVLSLFSALALAAATMSCSTGQYFLFNNTAGSHHRTVTPVAATTPAPAPTEEATAPVAADLTATADLATTPAPLTPAHKAQLVEEARTAVKALPAAQQAKIEKQAAKLVKKLEKRAEKEASQPAKPLAEGKSQIIALVLAVLVGGLGIHRFYLGYTGIGIAQLLTLGGCGIWALIDLIRIITGDLKPKDGDYAQKL